MIAHNPLHGSGLAALPHPALALGDNAYAAQGIGMTDDRHGQPASDEAPHAIPKDAAILAAPRQRAVPEPPHLEPKDPQRVQKSRFLGMQFQVELSHSFRKFRPKLIGIRFAVEAHHDVVCESHHDDIAVCTLLTPCLGPQIKYVMKIDVRQKRRGYSSSAKDNFSFDRVLRYR